MSNLEIEFGSLYPALKRLELKGWIDLKWETSEHNRRAKIYRLATAGRKQLVREHFEMGRIRIGCHSGDGSGPQSEQMTQWPNWRYALPWRRRAAEREMIRDVAIFLICGLGSIYAQNVPFRVQTQVVQVPVSVTDKEGRGVDGLVASDFTLLDDGVPQQVTVDDFSTSLAPISLAIVVQTSGISTPALAKIRTIGGMIQPLVTGANGAVAVVTFDSRIRWVQDFTSDDDKIRNAVKSLRAGRDMADARMLDAVAVIADHLRQRPGRRMLLLISESRDRGSKTTIQQALEAVARPGIEVFGAHYSAYATSMLAKPKDLPNLSGPPEFPDDPTDAPNPPPSIDFMAIFTELGRLGKTNAVLALTRATGGMDYPFLRERGIENAIEKLGLEVHSQYILSFRQPRNAEGLRQIEVSVPARSDLRIRSRQAYWAEPPADTQ